MFRLDAFDVYDAYPTHDMTSGEKPRARCSPLPRAVRGTTAGSLPSRLGAYPPAQAQPEPFADPPRAAYALRQDGASIP